MSSTQLRREIGGIALLLFGIFLAGVLVAYGVAELRAGVDARGSFGWVGGALASPLISFFGWPAALIVPLVPVAQALRLFGRVGGDARADRRWLILAAGLVLLLPMALGLTIADEVRATSLLAGLWGTFTAFYALKWLGAAGAWLFVLFGASVLTAVTLHWNPIRLLVGHAPRASADDPVAAVGQFQAVPEAGPRKRKRRKGEELAPSALLEPSPEEMPAVDPSLMVAAPGVGPGIVAGSPIGLAGTDEEVPGDKRRKRKPRSSAEEREVEIAAAIEATADASGPDGDELPVPELLTPPPAHNAEINARELGEAGLKLMEALQTFRVQGELVGRTTGPVVTQFEIEPAPGVKVRQFANLANDLALAMRAQSIRIVAPIPGRGAVGVEVPNPTPEIVAFRELLESREFQLARAALPIALGKDLEGKPVIADLAKMPHLLIAGATGSGKSVCVNTLITSLVYRHTPRTLRFLMVDPKMVELSVYNVLPHLRHKVVTDNRDAAAVLKWAVLEMQERYELLAVNGCRNIQDFNRRHQEGVALKRPKTPGVGFENDEYRGNVLPYIVVVIDELADLMMTVQGEVETPLALLAQKARAIGIHLILATQRPSVNVITGLIKANFPSRIAFRVASQVDSRTILDGIGAEALLGNGDMLFIPPGKSEPARLQGAFISSEDTERLTRWYEERREARRARFEAEGLFPEEPVPAEPDILETVRARELLESGQADADGEEIGDRDKLFREAAEVVIQHQQGSTSLLQRRLKVGYGRAARIIDQLHSAGVLGPPDGSKPRDVLVGLEELDRICGPR